MAAVSGPLSMQMVADGSSSSVFLDLNSDKYEIRYVMERTNATIKVWFWSRNSGSVPFDVKNSTGTVDTDTFVRFIFFGCM
jgi:hypothetical protein